jgi:hypothetical protein
MTTIINNLTEAVEYFIREKAKDLCKIEAHHDVDGNPLYFIIERKDKNCYFLFYREDSKKGYEDEFGLPGMGNEYINLNTEVIKIAAFDYNNAAIVIVLHNCEIRYARSLDVYNFFAKYNTIIE